MTVKIKSTHTNNIILYACCLNSYSHMQVIGEEMSKTGL